MSCTAQCHSPGPSQAHCGSCHRSFRNVAGFDTHRRDGRRCVDPAVLGLVEVGSVWATAEGHARAAADRARMAERRLTDGARATNAGKVQCA